MSSWDDALGALSHLEVVQGLLGQGLFPPACDEGEGQQPTAQEGPAVSDTPPPGPPPPRQQQQQQQQQAAANTEVFGKNPSQLLNEFYNRFKGHRDVSFEQIVDEANDKKFWHCTINLSGGRLNDRESLVSASFEAQDRSKKGAEAAASRAALEHLASMGYLNVETASAQSNKQDRWVLPQRRLPDSELVCLEFSAGPETGEGLPDGQIVVELFHDVAPQTLANLKKFFGLVQPGCLDTLSSPLAATEHNSRSQNGSQTANEHSDSQHDGQNGAAELHTNLSNGTAPHSNVAACSAAAHANGCIKSSSNGSAAAAPQGCTSSTNVITSSPNPLTQDSSTGVSAPSPNPASQGCGNGYVGCSLVCPVRRGCLAFTFPAILPHHPLSSQGGASGGMGSQGTADCQGTANCGTCCSRGPCSKGVAQSEDGAQSTSNSQSGPSVDPAKDEVVVDALARLLDMQEAGQGLEEVDEEDIQEDVGDDQGPMEQREEPQRKSQGSTPHQSVQEQQQQQQQQRQALDQGCGSARNEQHQQQQQEPVCNEQEQCDTLQGQQQQQEQQVLEGQESQHQSHQQPQQPQLEQQQCEDRKCEGQQEHLHHHYHHHHHHHHQEQQQQQQQQQLSSCIDNGEASDVSMLLRHDKPFRVSLLRDASTLAESAALNIIIPSLPAYNESHFIVGQVVRGYGMVRFLESYASNEDVMYGVYSKAASQKGARTGPYRISGCRVLPPTAKLEDVPVIMDGDWPVWPEDLPPVPPGMSEAEWRLCAAEALRAAANAAFKAGAWETAARKYTHALRYLSLRSLQSSSLKYAHKQQILDLQCRTLLNRSTTAVRLGQGLAAMVDAKNVLDQCPESHPLMPKALYRLGQGLMGVGRHEEAVERLQQAMQLTGSNAPDIRAAITQAKQLLKQQRARQGEAYARALQGWGSMRGPGASRRRGVEFDGGEFEEGRAWLMNPKAEAVLSRLGGDAPFRGCTIHEA